MKKHRRTFNEVYEDMSSEAEYKEYFDKQKSSKRQSKVNQVIFKFEQDYRVFTNHPYKTWKVYWGCSQIGEYHFPKSQDYRPEQTVTIARARECFEKSTVSVPTAAHKTKPIDIKKLTKLSGR